MINGGHVILYSEKADELRAWFHDVLELDSVDAGDGWLIFALPPSELAIHPIEGAGRHELYLMCDDINRVIDRLASKGVETGAITDRGWGVFTSVKLPDGGELGLYQPTHPRPEFTSQPSPPPRE